MGRGRFRHVVELSLLKSVRPDLLVAFLQPFATDLAAVGLTVPTGRPSSQWLLELNATLNRDGTELPAAIQAALIDIADLATPVGHEQIVTLADERGFSLAPSDAVAQEDLAFLVYLENRDLFRAARSRIRFFQARLFAEYGGQRGRLPSGEGDAEARVVGLRHQLIEWLRSRKRGSACGVSADDLQDQIVFLVAHGSAPTRAPEIEAAGSLGAARIPEQHDIVVFDKREGRLSVSARLPSERELYRAIFGLVLFGDDKYFRVVRLYHSRPLRERGSRALDVADIAGVERVNLTRLAMRSSDVHHSKHQFAADDLRPWLDSVKGRRLLHQRAIDSWTFEFRLRHDRSHLDVDVRPPNQLRIHRSLGLDLVHRFLQARGFEYTPTDLDAPPSSG